MTPPSLTSAAREAENRILASATALSAEVTVEPPAIQPESECELPQEQKSVRFAVIGDSGTGGTAAVSSGSGNGEMSAEDEF